MSELLAYFNSAFRHYKSLAFIYDFLTISLHFIFAIRSSIELARYKPNIYHYRCAFGLASLNVADKINAIKLCDHSIAYPAHIPSLIDNAGIKSSNDGIIRSSLTDPCLRYMASDIKHAHHIVVNSEFVKDSLKSAGVPISRISVIELSVEKCIINASIQYYHDIPKYHPSNLLFAGSWIKRKGVNTLANALLLLEGKAMLRIAGASPKQISDFCQEHDLSSIYFKPLGYLSRRQISYEMMSASIFVFPSFCEGYAKTIQEALICGCYIIATSNSGFSLQAGFHGTIISPGNPLELSQAILEAISNPSLELLCIENREIALKRFTPERYSSQMSDLYNLLINYQANGLLTLNAET